MPTTPAGLEVVRNATRDRVGYGIKAKGNEYREARQAAREAEYLVVIQQQERTERSVFDTFSELTKAIVELDRQANLVSLSRQDNHSDWLVQAKYLLHFVLQETGHSFLVPLQQQSIFDHQSTANAECSANTIYVSRRSNGLEHHLDHPLRGARRGYGHVESRNLEPRSYGLSREHSLCEAALLLCDRRATSTVRKWGIPNAGSGPRIPSLSV